MRKIRLFLATLTVVGVLAFSPYFGATASFADWDWGGGGSGGGSDYGTYYGDWTACYYGWC